MLLFLNYIFIHILIIVIIMYLCNACFNNKSYNRKWDQWSSLAFVTAVENSVEYNSGFVQFMATAAQVRIRVMVISYFKDAATIY